MILEGDARSIARLEPWLSVVGHVSALIDLQASARTHGALLRKRRVRSRADLLHLALLYGPGGLSLRGVAGFATAEEVVRLYRMRWQVELAFKRLQTLGGFAA